MRPFVLLDRDGTLIVDRRYLADPSEVELMPFTVEGLRLLRDAGYALIVATNQSGVGRGFFPASSVESVHKRLQEMLAKEGIVLDGIYSCLHRPEDQCTCRKPRTGLLERARADLSLGEPIGIIGDSQCDVDLGKALGIPSIVICQQGSITGATAFVSDFLQAARVLLSPQS